MSELATIWYFEPKYHRLASYEDEFPIGFIAHKLDHQIFFYAELAPREDCLWVYFPETPSITRFWRNADVAETIATENPEIIIFFAELVPPENDP